MRTVDSEQRQRQISI